MKERTVAYLWRKRARLLAEQEETARQMSIDSDFHLNSRCIALCEEAMIKRAGRIAEIEERLRQGGYGWPGKDHDEP